MAKRILQRRGEMDDSNVKIGLPFPTNIISGTIPSFSTTGSIPTDIPHFTTTPTPSSSPATITLPASTQTSPTSDATTTLSPSSTSTSTVIQVPAAAVDAASNMTAIVAGSTVGAVFFLISIALALWFFRRRRRGYAAQPTCPPRISDDNVESVDAYGSNFQRAPSPRSREMQQRTVTGQQQRRRQSVYGGVLRAADARRHSREGLLDGADQQHASVPQGQGSRDRGSSWMRYRSDYDHLHDDDVAHDDCHDDVEAQPQTHTELPREEGFVSPADSAARVLIRSSGTARTVSTVSSFGR